MSEIRRGACPSVVDPMPTGDGLLARLVPSAPLSLAAVAALCDASDRHGNGIIEVTQRGSLQFRGLSPATAPSFAKRIASLGLGADGGPAIVTSPLLGLDSEEPLDLRAMVAALRRRTQAAAASFAPKVSVLVDGGGPLSLDDLSADLRIRALDASRLQLSIAGDAAGARVLGCVHPQRAVDAAAVVLEMLARGGPRARGRDLLQETTLGLLRAALAPMLLPAPDEAAGAVRNVAARNTAATTASGARDTLGSHALHGGAMARGFAPAFGHTHADALRRLIDGAAHSGAVSIRPAPHRALMVIGPARIASDELARVAEAEGFITRPDDPRRYVVACSGAPACASAAYSTRSLAPAVARAAAALLDGSIVVHLSGCAKGCAHPGAAALTFVGADHLVVNGRAGDASGGPSSCAEFLAGVGRLDAQRRSRGRTGCSADMFSRPAASRVFKAMGPETVRD